MFPVFHGRMNLPPHRAPIGPRLVVLLALLVPFATATALPRSIAIAIPHYFLKGLAYGQTESIVALMLGIASVACAILAWKSRSYPFGILLFAVSFLATLIPFIAIAWVAPDWA